MPDVVAPAAGAAAGRGAQPQQQGVMGMLGGFMRMAMMWWMFKSFMGGGNK